MLTYYGFCETTQSQIHRLPNDLQQCLCSAQYQGQCVSKATCRKSTLNITEINHASPVLKTLTLYLFSSLQICFSKGHSPCYYVLFKIPRKGLEAILFASHLAEQTTPSRRQSTPFVVIFSKCWTNFSWSKVDIILDYLAYGSQKKKNVPIIIMFNSRGEQYHSEIFLR